jgi:thioredoxin reductase
MTESFRTVYKNFANLQFGPSHQLPTMSIHVIVIGAGLAGLSAAISTKVANPTHQVTMLESVKELAEIGVSISPPPLFKPISHPHLPLLFKTSSSPY